MQVSWDSAYRSASELSLKGDLSCRGRGSGSGSAATLEAAQEPQPHEPNEDLGTSQEAGARELAQLALQAGEPLGAPQPSIPGARPPTLLGDVLRGCSGAHLAMTNTLTLPSSSP